METDEDLGLNKTDNPKMIVIDYGGPNVAKPLHVGHLRSAIIGESVKQEIAEKWDIMFLEISIWETGDISMGLIITELKERKPELPYFDENFKGEYPAELHLPYLSWRRST